VVAAERAALAELRGLPPETWPEQHSSETVPELRSPDSEGRKPMSNLPKSTLQADAVREECRCVRDRAPTCGRSGRWHAHTDDACPVHPENLVA
jgi:hypothetical protein